MDSYQNAKIVSSIVASTKYIDESFNDIYKLP